MSDIDNTLRHGEMMLALGRSFGASEARSAVLSTLFQAQYRPLTEDEVQTVIAEMDAIITKYQDEHTAYWLERAEAIA